jgi:hypothetical protein
MKGCKCVLLHVSPREEDRRHDIIVLICTEVKAHVCGTLKHVPLQLVSCNGNPIMSLKDYTPPAAPTLVLISFSVCMRRSATDLEGTNQAIPKIQGRYDWDSGTKLRRRPASVFSPLRRWEMVKAQLRLERWNSSCCPFLTLPAEFGHSVSGVSWPLPNWYKATTTLH